MKRRLLCFFLAMIMCFSLFSEVASAEETTDTNEEESFKDSVEGEVVWEDDGTPSYSENGWLCYPVNAHYIEHTFSEEITEENKGEFALGRDGENFFDSEYEDDEDGYFYYFKIGDVGGTKRNIFAMTDGKVIFADDSNIYIESYDFDATIIYHAGEGTFNVELGQEVSCGDVITVLDLTDEDRFPTGYAHFWVGFDYGETFISWDEAFEGEVFDDIQAGIEITFEELWNNWWDEAMDTRFNGMLGLMENDVSFTEWYNAFIASIMSVVALQWKAVESALTNEVKYLNLQTVKDSISNVLSLIAPFSYLLACMFFVLGFCETFTKYGTDFLSRKVLVGFFRDLLLVATWIGTSAGLLRMIINLNHSMVTSVLAYTKTPLILSDLIAEFNPEEVDINFLIDAILQLIQLLFMSSILIKIVFALIVVTIIVEIKLIVRQITLAVMMMTSPAFFACTVSTTTKPYFKKFFKSFLSETVETFYMAVILYIGRFMYESSFLISIDTTDGNGLTTAKLLLLLTVCVTMIRIPKAVKQLIPRWRW